MAGSNQISPEDSRHYRSAKVPVQFCVQRHSTYLTCAGAIQSSKQSLYEWNLSLQDLAFGLFDCEPCGFIHFGEFAHLSRLGRPFHCKQVASQFSRIEVVFHSPAINDLTARLLHSAERDKFTVLHAAGLLFEFTLGGF